MGLVRRELLNPYQYSEEVKEAAAFRVIFGCVDAKQIRQELGIQAIQTIYHWVACYQQKIEENTLIHHSDRGIQYCSFAYEKKLKVAGSTISMSDSGEAYENPDPMLNILAGP